MLWAGSREAENEMPDTTPAKGNIKKVNRRTTTRATHHRTDALGGVRRGRGAHKNT